MADDQVNVNPYNKKRSKFARFLLKSWQPVPTWQSTIILFFLIGLALIGFGIALFAINANIVEISREYSCEGQTTCTIEFTVKEKIKNPIFFYYEIDNFYQNHRRYINSRSSKQLAGESVDESTLRSDCSPVHTNKLMGKTKALDGTNLKEDDLAIPCGLIAKSMFTDTYELQDSNNDKIEISNTNIAWPSDKGIKFKNPTPFDKSKQWIDMEDEHFIVWMRTAGLPDFRKLWGRIEKDLEAGDYKVIIDNTYDVAAFDGKKKFVLSTTGPFGGKNSFLAIAYVAVGGVCILISIFFFIRWLQFKEKKK